MSTPDKHIQQFTIPIELLLEEGFSISCGTDSPSPQIDLTVFEPAKDPSE